MAAKQHLYDLTQAQDFTLGDGHHLKAVGRGSVTLELELSKDKN